MYVTTSILDIPAQGRGQAVSERGIVRLGLIYNSNIASTMFTDLEPIKRSNLR